VLLNASGAQRPNIAFTAHANLQQFQYAQERDPLAVKPQQMIYPPAR
jgi:hypothetical protein